MQPSLLNNLHKLDEIVSAPKIVLGFQIQERKKQEKSIWLDIYQLKPLSQINEAVYNENIDKENVKTRGIFLKCYSLCIREVLIFQKSVLRFQKLVRTTKNIEELRTSNLKSSICFEPTQERMVTKVIMNYETEEVLHMHFSLTLPGDSS